MLDDAHQTVEQLRQELLEELDGQPLLPDELFLGGLTLVQYRDLPDVELWEQWSAIDPEELEKLEVRPEAVPAR